MRTYKEKKGLKTVLALCFTETAETYHHWHVFAGGSGGACIVFDTQRLLSAIDEHEGVKHQMVEYRTLAEMNKSGFMVNELPFVKRIGFKDEKEFRMVFESSVEERASIDLKFPLIAIDSIYLSPWVAQPLFEATKATLKSLTDCNGLKILRSTLVGNRTWKEAVNKAVGQTLD